MSDASNNSRSTSPIILPTESGSGIISSHSQSSSPTGFVPVPQSVPDQSLSNSPGSQSLSNSQSILGNGSNQSVPVNSFLPIFDLSMVLNNPPIPIVSDLSFSEVDGVGYTIVESEGNADLSGNVQVSRVTFDTTEPEIYDPDIHTNLTEVITTYDDENEPSSQTDILLDQIKSYAAEIQCSDFHGKGSIEDYTALFQAAGKIATESKQMELDIDIEGFNQFAAAADDLSELFSGFIIKLQNVNIITDITFLTSISLALQKIVNLSNIFGRFKQTVFNTTVIQFPKSAHDTKVLIEGVMDEVNCAMQYINYFVAPEANPNLHQAALSPAEKNIIAKSVETIDQWNVLCEHGVSIAMSNNPDVKFIQQASTELKQTTVSLKNAASVLKSKLATFNIVC